MDVLPDTRFTDPIAVETWDACFRWREGDVLHDVTIDDTWWRVAATVAAPNGMTAPLWAHHYASAFASWRLLPDERLLRAAGTGVDPASLEPWVAVLNAAAFVGTLPGRARQFDRAGFSDTASLAIHLLDDAMLVYGGPASAGLRIGIIGFGDALGKLGIAYASVKAGVQARAFAAALAEGCLRGSIDLAEERGPLQAVTRRQLQLWRRRGMPSLLLERAARHGIRHRIRTAIQSQQRLAMLADNATDALDPRTRPGNGNMAGEPEATAHRAICTAMQPWIDLPIDGAGPGPTFAAGDIADGTIDVAGASA
jgi:ribonucleoside-diphosphate reductase alpha chain